MGKDEEHTNKEPSFDSSIQKKHKKHKHKKHKKKKTLDSDHTGLSSSSNLIINKIKVKKDGISGFSKEKMKDKLLKLPSSSLAGPNMSLPIKTNKKKLIKTNKNKDSGTSSEEERWLDAIESGKLEEVDDELKKIKPKDPKLMTARQRAMFERKTDAEPNSSMEQLMSLPTGYKEKVMTAEAIQKAALKSLKRKQLADEKREKDKKKTMERLLKKQETKVTKITPKGKVCKRQVPYIIYKICADMRTVTLPPGMEYPLTATRGNLPPMPVLCAIPSCKKPKKYNCSKTRVPLCSLECYKANLIKPIL